MKKKALILGIESSCDETAASILEESNESVPNLLSNIVSSQEEIHKKFGGVVPELAARSHIDKIDLIVDKALKKSGKKLSDIDAIAVTGGPGLIVCLSVGLNFAKTLAMTLKKPLIVGNIFCNRIFVMMNWGDPVLPVLSLLLYKTFAELIP